MKLQQSQHQQQQQFTQVQVQKTTIMVVDGNSDDQSTKQTLRTNQIVANKNHAPKQQQHEQQKYQLHRPQKSNKPSKQQFLHSMPINNSNYSNRKITANVGVGGNDSGMCAGASTATGRTHTAQISKEANYKNTRLPSRSHKEFSFYYLNHYHRHCHRHQHQHQHHHHHHHHHRH
uniref:Uncharacterized protein n=1 Tax=Glossina austeni TaxID=7395 RepID=A0A1A9VJ88_GLOAU